MAERMPQRDTKVVGYFGYWSATQVVCTDVDACVVAGSSDAMEEYVAEMDPLRAATASVKKTRFGEILRGLELGGTYAFDEESYARFYPLALDAGLPVAAPDFEGRRNQGERFFTIRLAAA